MKMESFNGQENLKDIYTRITEDAVKVLNGREDLKPEIKKRAIAMMQNSEFRKKVKARWDEDTLRGVVHPDPEEQEKLWAKGLALKVLAEISSQESL